MVKPTDKNVKAYMQYQKQMKAIWHQNQAQGTFSAERLQVEPSFDRMSSIQ